MKQFARRTPPVFLVSLVFPLAVLVSCAAAQTTTRSADGGYNIVGTSITGASQVQVQPDDTRSKLELASSDPRLVGVFNWAKAQAMAYVFDGDPVGPWYEAVEPGREGFCIRDTCHQAMGAQALGLTGYNLNMLHHFAENISESKDWCSYWEINRYNRPAPVDYKNDAEFWYNLPSNFDLVDCCFRMYVWSGDQTYVTDPAFLNLYDRTVNDYVERWGLGIDQIMTRPRLLNVRGIFDPAKKFPHNRGIPGYDEHDRTYIVGFDVIATQYAAYEAYANIQAVLGNADVSQAFQKKADDVKNLALTKWWDDKSKTFYARLNNDLKFEGSGENRRAAGLTWGTVAFDDPDADNDRLLDLKGERLEYPEVSFTHIGTIVNGTMGINMVFTSPLLASVHGFWVETQVQTLSGLGTKIGWAELRNLPIRANTVTVRHDGMTKTTFINQHGPALIWLATFSGSHDTLLVNNKPAKAQIEKSTEGRETSFVRVTVGGGGTVSVEVPSGP